MIATPRNIRRGLPRVPGGEPWPPVGEVSEAPTPTVPETDGASHPAAHADIPDTSPVNSPKAETPAANSVPMVDVTLRRGLPRAPGGEPWPLAGVASAPTPVISTREEPVPTAEPAKPEPVPAPEPEKATSLQPAPEERVTPPAPIQKEAPRETKLYRGRTPVRWVGCIAIRLVALVAAACIVVLAARGVTTLRGVPEFLQRYPGEYEPRVQPEDGFPAWARWAHFLNFFFMILIIRSGLLVRHQQQPSAFYTPKSGGKKVSIYLWLHTSLDILWLVNGVVFVILLFTSGHWARLVPTSWKAFPNAVSAMLQYLTLEWPAENGWVNYNSLQQLMYFTIVFIAAPLAAITGVRLSEWWPKNAERLNRAYPAPLARAIHFPTMLFFSLFIVVHVFLVFATGALRNLNHMFAGSDTVSWAGFWWFTAALIVTVGITAAARPLILTPIAGLTGRISNR